AGDVNFGQGAWGVLRQLRAKVLQRIIPRAAVGVAQGLRGSVKREELAGVNADVGRLEVNVPVEIGLVTMPRLARGGGLLLQPGQRRVGIQKEPVLRCEALAPGEFGRE